MASMERPAWAKYVGQVMRRCWKALTGGLTVLLVLVVYQQGFGGHVPPIAYWVAASLSVIAALLQSGLQQYTELHRTVTMGEPKPYEHFSPSTTHGWRIPIGNLSGAKTIKNVEVQIINIDPRPKYWPFGESLPLQWTHSLKPVGSTERWERCRDIKAGSPYSVDFVYATEQRNSITISHSLDRVSDNTIPLPIGRYSVKVEAKGEDVTAAAAIFEIWVDGNGVLQCRLLCRISN